MYIVGPNEIYVPLDDNPPVNIFESKLPALNGNNDNVPSLFLIVVVLLPVVILPTICQLDKLVTSVPVNT